PRVAAGELPAGRPARGRRGLLLQGDRRDPRHPDRYRHEQAPPRKKGAAEAVVRVRSGEEPHCCRPRRRARLTMSEPTDECREALHELYGYLDGELTPEKRDRKSVV